MVETGNTDRRSRNISVSHHEKSVDKLPLLHIHLEYLSLRPSPVNFITIWCLIYDSRRGLIAARSVTVFW
jgi:hypothetical protein